MPDGLGDIRTRECRDPHDRQEEDDDCANGHPGDLNRRIAEHWRTVHQLGGRAPEEHRGVEHHHHDGDEDGCREGRQKRQRPALILPLDSLVVWRIVDLKDGQDADRRKHDPDD